MRRSIFALVVVLACWMLPRTAEAAIADAGNYSGCDNNGTSTCTIALTLTAGRGVLILAGHTAGGAALQSCSDGANSYTVISSATSGSSYAVISGCYTCEVTSGGSKNITLTFNQNTFGGAEAREVTGHALSSCLGVNGNTNAQFDPGTSSDAVTATLTTTQSNEYVYCISQEASFSGSAPNVGTGWSSGSVVGDFIHFPSRTEYQVKATAGAITGAFTANGASDDFLTKCVSFVSAGSVSCTSNLTATGVSSTEIQYAIDNASNGDTVCIPGGTGTLSSKLDLGTKQITLKGAGAGTESQCAVSQQTDYTCLVMASTNTSGLLEWLPTATGAYRITDVTFDGGTSGSNCADTGALVYIKGLTPTFIFDNNTMLVRRCHGMRFAHSVRGVIYSNSFHIKATGQFGAFVNHDRWNDGSSTCVSYGPGCGDRSWADDSEFGSPDKLYFEDNTMTADYGAANYFVDGWSGQRMVFRNNSLTDLTIQNHGTDSNGRMRGGRAMEVYRNTFTFVNLSISACIGLRGGTALIWGNTVTTSGGECTRIAHLTHQRNVAFGGSGCSYWYCSDDATNISSTSATNDWHVNQGNIGTVRANSFDASGGYPAMDQVGRGKGDLLSGDEDTGGVTPVGFPNQVLDPVYCFKNTLAGALTVCEPNTTLSGLLM